MTEIGLEDRRKRLRYRSWHRGCKETDLVFGPFADAHVDRLDAAQVERFEALLDEADNDLFNWLTGRSEPPARVRNDVWHMLETFQRSKSQS